MDPTKLRELLEKVRLGEVTVSAAMTALARLPYENIGHSRVDHHRQLRTGIPEVILSEGKSLKQVTEVAQAMARAGTRLLITRVEAGRAEALVAAVPLAVHHEAARIVSVDPEPLTPVPGVTVVTAGTSDVPVAEEAAVTASLMGSGVERHFDVGVAGLHRLLDILPRLIESRAVIAVAGMDGALPSVVGGLVRCPVIAVPTSVGYGASFGGISALLTMLNSCSPGVCVVNIDNGFGAGVLAAMINGRSES